MLREYWKTCKYSKSKMDNSVLDEFGEYSKIDCKREKNSVAIAAALIKLDNSVVIIASVGQVI